MSFLIRTLTRTGIRRGVMAGSRPWLVVGITGAALQLLARVARENEEVVVLDKLRPGDRFEISFEPHRK